MMRAVAALIALGRSGARGECGGPPALGYPVGGALGASSRWEPVVSDVRTVAAAQRPVRNASHCCAATAAHCTLPARASRSRCSNAMVSGTPPRRPSSLPPHALSRAPAARCLQLCLLGAAALLDGMSAGRQCEQLASSSWRRHEHDCRLATAAPAPARLARGRAEAAALSCWQLAQQLRAGRAV